MTTQLSLLDRDWIEHSIPEVLRLMAGRTFCADDLHGILPPPEQRNWYGALMAKLRNQGLIEKVGYQPSARRAANGRVLALWVVKNSV